MVEIYLYMSTCKYIRVCTYARTHTLQQLLQSYDVSKIGLKLLVSILNPHNYFSHLLYLEKPTLQKSPFTNFFQN